MCGIVGVIGRDRVAQGTVEEMTKVISYRGPNGDGHFYQDTFAFGHRRLSIVDLSDCGRQPMRYLDRYVITYNGEVYNHIEIRRELEALGYSFNSTSDTEVIMAAYDKWGPECLSKFNGMWALAIYDSLKKEFFISRDRFGIKPLYYCQAEGGFIFASEVKALAKYAGVVIEPNEAYLKNYLSDGPREYLTETAFKGIFRLPPASFVLGRAEDIVGKKIVPTIFWTVKPNTAAEYFDPERAAFFAKKYYDLLEDAVRLRLRADVKVGSALSGGLDSSSIVYLINKVLREQGKTELQETFSSVYKAPGTEGCDESAYIDMLAKELNVKSNQIEPLEQNIPAEHEKMIWAMENPPESTCMSGWHTFKKVADTDVVVTLDGQGADEQLGGYLYYLPEYLTSLKFKEVYKEARAFNGVPGAKKFIIKGLILAHLKLVLGEFLLKCLFKMIKGRDLRTNLNERFVDDMFTSLITLIHYSDHVSMAHSVESRMPFMDYRMVEFLAAVPACYKIHNGWTKYLARAAFDKKIPDDICWRKDKMGWPIPERVWFFGNLSGWVVREIKSSALIKRLNSAFDVDEEIHSKHDVSKVVRFLNLAVLDKLYFS